MKIEIKPDGKVYRNGKATGEIVSICGETPKYFIDCHEWMRSTYG